MRILSFDLECTSLSGMVGRMLCCSFKPVVWGHDSPPYTFRGDSKEYRSKDIADDSKLALAIRDELESVDMIVGHNSKLFDRKFLNARLLKAGSRPLKSMWHIDTMWVIRTHIAMSSKLDNIQKFLGLPIAKTPITWDNWMRGAAYDREAMNIIVEHCEHDVEVLVQSYWRLLPYVRDIRRA